VDFGELIVEPFCRQSSTSCNASTDQTQHNKHPDAQPNNGKYHANHPADFAGLRHSPTGWVHCPRSHLPQVTIAHYPRNDATDKANHDAKYPQDQNDYAPMGLERLLRHTANSYRRYCDSSAFYHNILLTKSFLCVILLQSDIIQVFHNKLLSYRFT
jgi:hypothetical protein